MSALDALPPWCTTGIGSLPHADPGEAAVHATWGYDLPFIPQLPRLDGDMVTEWMGSDPLRCGWSPDRDRQRPVAWRATLHEVRDLAPVHCVIKLQVTGPVTLALALQRRMAGAPVRSETISLAREISRWLAANVADQVAVLSEHGLRALVTIDEPSLASAEYCVAAGVWDPIRAVSPSWGLHLCCKVPWDSVEHTSPDVLFFDLVENQLDHRSVLAIRRLLLKGTKIGWGVIAAHRDERAYDGIKRLQSALALVSANGRDCLVTASCGTGRVSLERENELSGDLADVASVMRSGTPLLERPRFSRRDLPRKRAK